MTQNSGYEPSREPAGRQPEPQQPARNGYSHDDGGYATPQGQEAPYQNGYDRGDGYRTGDDQQGYNQQQGGYDQQGYQQPYNGQSYDQPGYDQQSYQQGGYDQQAYTQQPYEQAGYEQGGNFEQTQAYPQQGYAQPQGGYAPTAQSLTATLQLEDGSGRHFQLRDGSNVIGRGQEAQFRLPDTGVSRRHIDIRWDGRTAMLSDLGSTNGTTVNGAPVQDWQLADGDIIRAGHSEILVRIL